eukprot:856554-Amorphochlora_amoeboformis.AAC.1
MRADIQQRVKKRVRWGESESRANLTKATRRARFTKKNIFQTPVPTLTLTLTSIQCQGDYASDASYSLHVLRVGQP